MPANKSSPSVYFMRKFNSQVYYQKCVSYKYWKRLLIKKKKKKKITVNYASTTNQTNIY